VLLGVDPAWQKNGLGGALLKHVLSKLDEGRFAVYLETAESENLRFYRKHGFELQEHSALPDDPYLW
jgi:ribosomal protein S18 acetylase RimI-like enzyme